MSQEHDLATYAANELDGIYERLVELEDFAVEMGFRAVEHKIQEAQGKVLRAAEAARQYADGTLVSK